MARPSTRAKHIAAFSARVGARSEDTFSRERPHPCERLAKVAGETNYWVLYKQLSGAGASAEFGTDSTADMGALAIAERRSGIPGDVLLAYWAGLPQGRHGIGAVVLAQMIDAGFDIKPRDAVRVKGAILDAVDRFRGVDIGDLNDRAKRRRMDVLAYKPLVKWVESSLWSMLGYLQPEWVGARFNTKKNRESL